MQRVDMWQDRRTFDFSVLEYVSEDPVNTAYNFECEMP